MQNHQILPNIFFIKSLRNVCISLVKEFSFFKTLSNFLLKWEKKGVPERERERERDRETLTWQRAVGNRAASLSALIRGRRGHKGMPCRETPMSRRWEAVKGCSKLFLPTGLFPL